MEYYNLSKETLIHEIEQLNRTIEKIKFSDSKSYRNPHEFLNAIPSPVVLIDMDYRIQWANQYTIDHFDTLHGRKCYEALYGFDDLCPGCPHKVVIENKVILTHNVKRDNQIWENQLIPLDKSFRLSGIIEVQRMLEKQTNIEESYKEQIDRLQKEKQDLERRLKARNHYIERFSIELRTPLKALKGLNDYFDKESLTKIQREYLEVLKYNSNLLNDLFTRAALMMRYEEGNYREYNNEYDIQLALKEVVNSTTFIHLKTGGERVSFQSDQTIPTVLIGDELKMKVVMGLLLDFVEYVTKGRALFVNLREISSSLEKVTMKITITDNRIKTKQVSENLKIEDFIDHLDHQTLEGSLAVFGVEIAQKLLQSMDAFLKIKYINEKGVHLSIYFSHKKVLPQTKAPLSETVNRKRRILIVDKELIELSFNVFQNYEIYFAKTGREGRQLFTKMMPDLTIVDVMINDYDGFTLLDEIEKLRHGKQKVVAISNQLIDNERDFLVDYGFDDYYSKPINQETLKKIFDSCMI